jgi:hypothetical protein
MENKLTGVMLVREEENCIACHSNDKDSAQKNVELYAFAVRFSAWADTVVTPTRPSHGNGKTAKWSTLKVVGYHGG